MSLGGDIGNKLIEIVEKVRADLIANDFATKSYVEEIISSGIVSKIVATLPAEGEQGIIYLVPVTTQLQTEYNVYKEYVYVNGAWEDLGSTELNLEDYPNKIYITDRLATKLNKNDPSIPTKLSDLILDGASKFVSINIVTALPDVSTAKTNEIYLVLYENKFTCTGVKDYVVHASEVVGDSITITNNGDAAIKVFKTLAGGTEETTASLTITIGKSGTLTIPADLEQFKISSLTNTMNVIAVWNRDLPSNYVKYIKVNGAWEVLRNPDSVSFDYLRTNYYRKGEIYTAEHVNSNIDNLITMLDTAEYDSTIAWANAYKPAVFGSNTFVAIAYDRINYFAYTSNGEVSTSNNLTDWSALKACTNLSGMSDIVYSDALGKFMCIDGGALKASTDGITWITMKGLSTGVARIANSYRATVVMINKSTTSLEMYVTTDGGESGTTITVNVASAQGTYNVLYYDGAQFVAVNDNGYIITSIDGRNWTVTNTVKTYAGAWVDAAYNGRHVAILRKEGAVIYSTDSSTFTANELEPALSNYSSAWVNICSGGSMELVALSSNGYLAKGTGYLT